MTFASPNALSAYRRLGLTADLDRHAPRATSPPQLAVAAARRSTRRCRWWSAAGRARETEVEAAGTTVRLRVDPAGPGRACASRALVLCRDVTEVRRRERELVGKDATIREIHHRVKNNLQTVAALLRLQAPAARRRRRDRADRAGRGGAPGRLDRAGARDAVADRSTSGVDFDEIADRVAGMVGERGRRPGRRSRVRREGELRAAARRRWRRRWRWCWSSWCRTPSSTGSPRATAAARCRRSCDRRERGGCGVAVGRRRRRAAGGLRPRPRDAGPGPADRPDAGGGRARRRAAARSAPAGTAAPTARQPGRGARAAVPGTLTCPVTRRGPRTATQARGP